MMETHLNSGLMTMIHSNEQGDIELGARSALCTLHAVIEFQTPTICHQGGPRAKAEPEPPAERGRLRSLCDKHLF